MKTKKKLVSALAIVLLIPCILLIAGTLTTNILFSDAQATPRLFGYDMFLYTEPTMEPDVYQNAFVHFEEKDTYTQGDIILYEAADQTLHISKIARIDSAPAEEGGSLTLDVVNSHGQAATLNAEAIRGLCIEQNRMLGKILLFASSKNGIILLLVVPCVLVLVYIISRFIAAAQDDEDDEPIELPAGLKKMRDSSKQPQSPLFTPESAAHRNQELEEKKASLAENFTQKAADSGKKKSVEKYDMEEGRRALEQAAAERRRERVEKLKAVQISRDDSEQELAPRSDLDDRVAEIKRAMEQRAAERRRQQEEEARMLADTKARSVRSSSEIAEELVAESAEAVESTEQAQAETHEVQKPVEAPKQEAEPVFEETLREATEAAAAEQPATAPTTEATGTEGESVVGRPTVRSASERRRAIQERAATQRQRQTRVATPRRPASHTSSGPASFEELMAKLDEEKNKLNGSR